ncbi:type I DNA topoisomerase [bacterium]|nr:type I DNA topoisomerase [bacterium]
MPLLIVESPTKSKTLKKFLDKKYHITATKGHIRDLPERKLGIDIENNFKPTYTIIPRAKKIIQLLKKETEKTDLVIIATDPDREGEAIAWHLTQILELNGIKPYQRIVFHEITKRAIEQALKNLRKIDINLVNAQQARRILDRLVGYKLSPFLWKKVAKGLSAGRVQSVAVRLIVEREREIQNFKPEEYWTIEALLSKARNQNSSLKTEFLALLIKKNGKTIPKMGIKTKKEAHKIVSDLKNAEYKIINIDKKETKRNPLPPFTTSTLQQEAWKKFHWPAKFTMNIAQNLYENGLITYHRTDSLNLSNYALLDAKEFIIKNYGKEYWPGFSRKYKAKGKVQEAHEAIRPTQPSLAPQNLSEKDKNKQRLYELIWRRFIACQMSCAEFDSTIADIFAKNYIFRARGQILKFDGFLKVYPIKFKETQLPNLEINEILKLIKIIPSSHLTQPPPRYTEATLIKTLEEYGIGRPSTYAPIIFTIQQRNYVEKIEGKFRPTEIGFIANDILVENFPNILDIKFTARMEEDLDKIAKGEKQWIPVISEFYKPFEKNLKEKYEIVKKKNITEKTNKKCPLCGAPLVIKLGKFGKFYACSNFPKCKYTEKIIKSLGIKCPKCKEGEIVERKTKKGKIFYGCSKYPDCDFVLWDKPNGEKCPKCGSLLVLKNNKIKCSNKNCDYIKSNSKKGS